MNPTLVRYRRDLWQLLGNQSILGDAAEVGTAEGNFAEEILRWPVAFRLVYLVDRWKSMPMMRGDSAKPQAWHDANRIRAASRVARFKDRVQVLHMESVAAARVVPDASLSFVNVDADHSYEGVRADILAWWPKLKTGAVISFHDYEQPSYGVKRAVSEFASERGLVVYELPEDKEEDAGAFLIKC